MFFFSVYIMCLTSSEFSNIMVLYQVSMLVIDQMLTAPPLSCELITSFLGPIIFITDVTENESRYLGYAELPL